MIFLSNPNNCSVGWSCKIRWFHLCRGVRFGKRATGWPWMATWNIWEWDPGGWAFHDLGAKLLRDQKHSTSVLTWTRRAVRGVRFDQSVDHVKSLHLYNEISTVFSKLLLQETTHQTFFYLKAARKQRSKVSCVERKDFGHWKSEIASRTKSQKNEYQTRLKI